MGFRPLTGIKVSERQMKNFRGTTPEVSVPSRGLRYLNQTAMLHYIHQRYVSVPSRGLRYLNDISFRVQAKAPAVSVPSRGLRYLNSISCVTLDTIYYI